jgi:serine/threonine protein kinase
LVRTASGNDFCSRSHSGDIRSRVDHRSALALSCLPVECDSICIPDLSASLVDPTRLGKYDITGVLGKGAMGVVYAGVDSRLRREVAIKTILKNQLMDSELAADYSKRFEREAQAVARLNHPNIVTVYDFGEEGDVAYLVMEFIRGRELKHYFDQGQYFELPESIRLMGELLGALDHAHANGIIHRDVKPANVMIDAQGRVKLTDFGVARINASQEGTRIGTRVGTLAYMSPEQIKGLPINSRADVFAAGIILYQFLAHRKPFTGSEWEIQSKIVGEHPPWPSTLRSDVPVHFDLILAKALAKNPEDRFASARELARALSVAPESFSVPTADETTRFITGGALDLTGQQSGLRSGITGVSGISKTPTGPSNYPPSEAAEIEFWRSIKDSTDAEDYELYLSQFPAGTYSELARRRIAKFGSGVSGASGGVSGGALSAADLAARQRAAEEEARRLAQEVKRQAELEARRKVEEEQARRAAEEAKRKAAAEAMRREAEEEARRKEEERRRQAEAEAARIAEAEARRRAEADAARQAEEEAQRKADEEARRKVEEEAKRKAEAETKRLADAEAKRRADEQAKRKAEEDSKRKAEADANRKSEVEARQREESQAKLKAEEELARLRAEALRQREEEAARAKAEQEAKQRETEAAKQRQTEEEARRRAAAEAKRQSEDEARRRAAEAKRRAEVEAEAKRRDDEAKRNAEAEAKRRSDEAEAKRRADAAERQKLAEAQRLRQEEDVQRKAAESEARRGRETSTAETGGLRAVQIDQVLGNLRADGTAVLPSTVQAREVTAVPPSKSVMHLALPVFALLVIGSVGSYFIVTSGSRSKTDGEPTSAVVSTPAHAPEPESLPPKPPKEAGRQPMPAVSAPPAQAESPPATAAVPEGSQPVPAPSRPVAAIRAEPLKPKLKPTLKPAASATPTAVPTPAAEVAAKPAPPPPVAVVPTAPPVAQVPAVSEGATAKKQCLQYLREQETVLAIRACNRARELGESVPEVARRQ